MVLLVIKSKEKGVLALGEYPSIKVAEKEYKKLFPDTFEELTILEAVWILATFQGPLGVESDSSNVVGWSSKCDSKHWKFQFHFNEINELSSFGCLLSSYIRSVSSMADDLAKQGVDDLLGE